MTLDQIEEAMLITGRCRSCAMGDHECEGWAVARCHCYCEDLLEDDQ